MKMKKNTIPIILCAVCAVLSVFFILGGLYVLKKDVSFVPEQKNFSEGVEKLQQEKAQLKVEDTQDEVAAIEQACTELQQSIEAAESECVRLDEEAIALQEEYERLCADETNIYYMTILDALKKGMGQVEQYLENAQ